VTEAEVGARPMAVDEETFALVAELEVRKALRLQYAVSLLSIQAITRAGGGSLDVGLPDQLARIVSRLIRSTDLMHPSSGSAYLLLLLVGALSTDLDSVTRRITDEVANHHLLVRGEPTAVRLRIGSSCFPTTASSSREMLNQAIAGMTNGE
jgi:hypothetical protein